MGFARILYIWDLKFTNKSGVNIFICQNFVNKLAAHYESVKLCVMRIRLVDSENDWMFGRGHQNYAKEALSVMYNVKTKLQSWIGDCFFDAFEGIDWQNRIGRYGQGSTLKNEIQQKIVSVPGVLSIDYINISGGREQVTCDYSINTIYSTSMSDVLTIIGTSND